MRAAGLLLALALLAPPARAQEAGGARPGAWLRYPLPGAEVKSLVAEPRVPGLFFAGTAHGGIYRSTDGGRSWKGTAGGPPFPGYAVSALAPDPVRPGTFWAALTGVVRGGLLARSDDAGATFVEVRRWDERAGARALAVAVVSGRRVVAVGGDGGIEISADGGASWRPSRPPLDPGSGISFLAFHPAKPGVLYSGSFRHPVRSTDLGRTWRRIAGGMIEDTEVFALDFSPASPDDTWAATCGWVYRTTNGGESWTRYKEGLLDRRTHAVRVDPKEPSRVLAGTTGGLFESRDAGRSFRRLGPDVVVNALLFDPSDPRVLLVATEAEGVLRSEDGGETLSDSNVGLAEARVSAVATTASGRVVAARAADGKSGGLWEVDPTTGRTARLPAVPPSTIGALVARGERLLAGTPDGLFSAESPAGPFAPVLRGAVRGLAAGEGGEVAVATDAGLHLQRRAGGPFERMGSLGGRIDGLWRVRVVESGLKTFAALSQGWTYYWDGRDWSGDLRPARSERKLQGGFGRPRPTRVVPVEPLGAVVDAERGVVVFRPEEAPQEAFSLALPERGLAVAGWTGDPRRAEGLYLATMGRGLFRYVPPAEASGAGEAVGPAAASW